MRVTVVGGGSTYTPELVDGIARLRDSLDVEELVLVDPAARRTLRDADVLSKAGWTPYDGREVTGRVVRTYLRGEPVARDGVPVGALTGRFLPGPGAAVVRSD